MKIRMQSPLWRRVVRTFGRLLFRLAENNDEPRFNRNGEGWLLRELLAAHARTAADRAFVAFDGGANAGEYARAVLAAARDCGCSALVHAFEPSRYCQEKLLALFPEGGAVRVVGAALGDRSGAALLHGGQSGSSQASLVPRALSSGGTGASITVPVLRLDEYWEREAVSRVDLLKLDVEGSELAALRGLGERLHPEMIDVIQFEYGGAALDAGTTLRDCYQLLVARGYSIAKVMPGSLELRAYRPWMEHYAYANYVAISPRWLAGRIPPS